MRVNLLKVYAYGAVWRAVIQAVSVELLLNVVRAVTVTFLASQTRISTSIAIVNRTFPSATDKKFYVRLMNPRSGALLSSDSMLTVNIAATINPCGVVAFQQVTSSFSFYRSIYLTDESRNLRKGGRTLSFPSSHLFLFFSLSLSLPLEAWPLKPAKGSRERCKLPQ